MCISFYNEIWNNFWGSSYCSLAKKILRIMVGAKPRGLFKRFQILHFPCKYIFPVMNSIVTNQDNFQINYVLCSIIVTDQWPTSHVFSTVHGLSGKFPHVQNSPPFRRPSAARQVLLCSNEFDELRRENRIALSCLVIVLCFFM